MYYISLTPIICNRKLAKRLKLQFAHNFTQEIFRFAEQRNFKITYLFLSFYADRIAMFTVQNFSTHEFPERIFSHFISSSP